MLGHGQYLEAKISFKKKNTKSAHHKSDELKRAILYSWITKVLLGCILQTMQNASPSEIVWINLAPKRLLSVLGIITSKIKNFDKQNR